MIFVKIPGRFGIEDNNDYDNVLRELGLSDSSSNTYMYLNVTGFSVAPFVDDNGIIDERRCILVNQDGKPVVTLNKTPRDCVDMLGHCIMEVG